MNLRASSRGLYAGMIQTCEPGIGWIDGTKCEAISISSNWITNSEVPCEVTGAEFILVVEKEGAGSQSIRLGIAWRRVFLLRFSHLHLLPGIFSRLSEDAFWRRYPCIIVTGRGFPDLATRALVHQVSTRFKLPVFGIADCNPFGLALLLTYKFGSAVTLSSILARLNFL